MRFAPPNPLRIADRASGLNAPSVRSYNERLVLSLLLQSEGTTRLEIGQKTKLSAQTISVIVRSLEQESLVAKGEAQRGRMGPPTIPMILNPEGAFSVGVSFGTQGTDVVVIDFVGTVRFHKAHRYEVLRGEDEMPMRILIEEAIRSVDSTMRGRIAGVGLAVPDEALVGPGIRKALGHDLAAAQANLESALGLPVFMQNDVTAAAGGESLFGVTRHIPDFVFFYLGSRLHRRLVLNHQIHSGGMTADVEGGLLQLNDALSRLNRSSPVDRDGIEKAWRSRCRGHIVDQVSVLLNFVGVRSLVLSTYAPSETAAPLLLELAEALPGIVVLAGKNSAAPKAWGAASLPYHSRFMVQ